ncbi:hypothetical protein BgiMline_017579, partial [Biomphalaria glabrata]
QHPRVNSSSAGTQQFLTLLLSGCGGQEEGAGVERSTAERRRELGQEKETRGSHGRILMAKIN